jgi:hypothetical protein
MNGVTSRSMREKGLEYRVNWGIPLAQLKESLQDMIRVFICIRIMEDDVREVQISHNADAADK